VSRLETPTQRRGGGTRKARVYSRKARHAKRQVSQSSRPPNLTMLPISRTTKHLALSNAREPTTALCWSSSQSEPCSTRLSLDTRLRLLRGRSKAWRTTRYIRSRFHHLQHGILPTTPNRHSFDTLSIRPGIQYPHARSSSWRTMAPPPA
jgi:hypothetical protein